MIENKNVSVTAETPEFKAMLAHAQSLIDAYYAANGYDVAHKPVITATEGPRYFRVMKLEGPGQRRSRQHFFGLPGLPHAPRRCLSPINPQHVYTNGL